MHEDNPVQEVAYLQYHDLSLEEKSPEQLQSDKELMDELMKSRSQVSIDHLQTW